MREHVRSYQPDTAITASQLRTAILALLVAGCSAGRGTAHDDPCEDTHAAAERQSCYAGLAAGADSTLERTFALAMERTEATAELQAAQVAWEGYVNLHCHAIHENAATDETSGVFARCRRDLALTRAGELRASYLADLDTGLSVP